MIAMMLAMQMRHGGVPAAIVAGRPAGPYVVSLWGTPDVGTGMLYVVYDAPAGRAFTAPASVRVVIAPVSGRLPEAVYVAHAEQVRHGARFVAHVAFDRSEVWRVRVVTNGPAGAVELSTQVDVLPPPTLGPLGLGLYALPFVLVAAVWWRAAVVRRRIAGRRLVLATH